jgi:uncharacterized protein YlbG (UPF0298 family)
MIDINNPNSEYIFKACGFLDRLKNYTRLYILQSFEERQETFEKMTSECDQLILFSKKKFIKLEIIVDNQIIEIKIATLSKVKFILPITLGCSKKVRIVFLQKSNKKKLRDKETSQIILAKTHKIFLNLCCNSLKLI